MKEERSDIEKAMQAKFQVLVERSETDPQLKTEVMTTIHRIENISTLLDLFTIKMAKTESSILQGLGGRSLPKKS